MTAKYQMNMRYPGQNFALSFDVQVDQGLGDLAFIDDGLGAKALRNFNARHMEEYGHIREAELPELTGLRLSTHVETPSPAVGHGFSAPATRAPAARTRLASLGHGFQQTEIFRGADLKPGHDITGPAIIEESFTTIVVYPGWTARVDDAGDYEMTRLA